MEIPAELFEILKEKVLKVLHSVCQQIWKIQQWPQDWNRSVFIPIPKEGNTKEHSNYLTVHSSHKLAKECSKFSKPGFNSFVKRELPDVQAGVRKGRGTRDQIANICWIIEKAREFRKTSTSASLTTLKFDCVDGNKLENS